LLRLTKNIQFSPKSGFICILMLVFAGILPKNAQSQDGNFSDELIQAEDSLKYYLDSVRTTKVEKNKYYWNNKFRKKLEKTLEMPNAFNYPFDKLKSIGKLVSPDKYFRIFNWNVENIDLTQNYFGYILVPSNKKEKVIELSDRSAAIDKPESQTLDNKRWYGCLYYKIIVSSSKGRDEYTLLGFDMNNRATKKRIIEVMSFSGNKVNFGAGIFDYDDKTLRKRVVFEYSAEVQMALRYEENNTRIVFDHLSPDNKDAEGIYEYYFPDGSYDALVLEDGRWKFLSDVDVRGEKTDVYNDPSKDDPRRR
jgi:hypothetical protein